MSSSTTATSFCKAAPKRGHALKFSFPVNPDPFNVIHLAGFCITPFDQLSHGDSSRSTNGAGLDLAIAMNVARSHGGAIKVNSETGQGTAVTVQLAAS
ncbi:MAG: sensor histidine kinase [Anaerolineae bacterium]|nr:sensor histidine kinase [Anaerolineae bacterium]